ncbi:hypothetical protein ACNIRM_25055 [Escherichia coli]
MISEICRIARDLTHIINKSLQVRKQTANYKYEIIKK